MVDRRGFSSVRHFQGVEGFKAVVTAAHGSGFRIIYAGHSMGGAVGTLTAASDDRIKFLISLPAW